jgi:acyl carrier protein
LRGELGMNQQVIEMVNTVMHEQFEVPVDKLVGTANLKEDLQLDSLDFVDMIVTFEEKIGGQIQNIDFLNIKTLGDIYNLVQSFNENKN